jgi:prevent-host-death family protein
MISAGIKELKAKLSSYIDIAKRNEQVIITEHGKEVAILIPISKERRAINALVDEGMAHWAGEKPEGLVGIKIKGKPLSETILEERR